MAKLKVQLNHPGGQKRFKLGSGYELREGKIFRHWNSDKIHYRKFLVNRGFYVETMNDVVEKEDSLYFWGEWEGNSIFEKFENLDNRKLPNGLHKPFHSTKFKGTQNTDPYVYGENFKYAVCKQVGSLCHMDQESLILFGSTYPSLNIFYIDTVFVVNHYESAKDISLNNAKNYTKIYIEETLKQLGNEYFGNGSKKEKNLYQGQTWWDNNRNFSYVPCKLNKGNAGFERLAINLDDEILKLSKNATGKSFLLNCNLTPEEIWLRIYEQAISQGFVFGIRFNEPEEKSAW